MTGGNSRSGLRSVHQGQPEVGGRDMGSRLCPWGFLWAGLSFSFFFLSFFFPPRGLEMTIKTRAAGRAAESCFLRSQGGSGGKTPVEHHGPALEVTSPVFLFCSVSEMASVLSRRLGKRSLLGTRVAAPSALAEGVLVATQIPGLQTDLGRASAHLAPQEDGSFVPPSEETSQAPRFPSPGRRQLHTGQQVRKEALGVLGWSDAFWWGSTSPMRPG